MTIKMNALTVPKEKLETEYQVTRWQKGGEALGWTYECVLPKLQFEKISVKVGSEQPVIAKEELAKQGMALVHLANLHYFISGGFLSLEAFCTHRLG